MPPHATFPQHAHLRERFEIILEDSLLTENGVLLGPGDVMVARSGEQYGPLSIEFGSFETLREVAAGVPQDH